MNRFHFGLISSCAMPQPESSGADANRLMFGKLDPRALATFGVGGGQPDVTLRRGIPQGPVHGPCGERTTPRRTPRTTTGNPPEGTP